MRHRLFHSLVISSSFLLDACASTHVDGQSDASPQPDAGPSSASDAGAAADAFFAPDAFVQPDAFAPPDAYEAPDAFEPPDAFAADDVFVDPRACEPGWPTTKGVFHVIRDGLAYGCRHSETSNPETPNLDECCILGTAEEFGP